MSEAEKQAVHDAVTLRNFIELERLRREAAELRQQFIAALHTNISQPS